jgi:tripartite-type tricarboxylate transporter receptor subunit TctC
MEENMRSSNKATLRFLVLVLGIAAATPPARSQDKYPSRPIEMVVAFPAGGFADLTGRIFADEMSKVLNVTFTPVNKGGATGSLAASGILRAPKDGYHVLVNTLGGMVLAPIVLKDVTYDPSKDFYPVAYITSAPDGLTVRAESPFKSLQDLIDAAKRNPGKLSYGTAGTGVGGHFNAAIFAQNAGIKIRHVPYKGGGEYIPALLGGHIDFVIGTAIATLPHEQAGKMRTLAFLSDNTMKALPGVRTASQLGVKGDFLDSWAGCFVATGTPKAAVDTLVSAADKVLKSASYIERIEKTGGIAQYLSPAQFQTMIEKNKKTAIETAKREGLQAK